MRFTAHSIISRSRRYLVILLVLLGLGLMVEWRQLAGVQAEISALAGRATPVLTSVAELPRLGHRLRALTAEIPVLRSDQALDEARLRIETVMSDLEAVISRADLADELPALRRHLQLLTTAQADILRLRAMAEDRHAVARRHLDDMLRTLMPAHDRTMLGLLQANSAAADGRALRGAVAQVVLLSEMKTSLSRLSLHTGASSSGAGGQEPAIRSRFVTDIANLATRMTRVTDSALRLTLARHLGGYRDATIGRDGLVDLTARLQELEHVRAQASADVAQRVGQVELDLARLSLASASAFETSAQGAAETLQQGLWFKLVMTVSLVCVALGFLWFFIQRNILDRLSAIASRVDRLNSGDLSEVVPVTGQDEIGAIEHAVEHARQTALALRRTNEELENFAYAAAHDLRTPLRAVADLVDWTREDFGADLPQGARDNLGLIEGRVRRLSGHLGGLLDYARAGETEEAVSLFDLGEFVQDLRAVFVGSSHFDIVLADAPPAFLTCPVPVRTILLNLVGNAIKHHDRSTGRIEIGCTMSERDICLTVADDGPGIEPVYHDRIFLLFQTLRARDEVDCSGLGLAMVRKLAARLGGSVTVASDPARARGSTFTLRLPRLDAGDRAGAPSAITPPPLIGDLAA